MLRDLRAALVCTLIAGAALLAGGGIWAHVAGGDLHGLYLPKYEAAAQAARALRLPLWNPYEFCGTPLLANAQGAVLYPPVVLLFATLPSRAALQAFYVLHLLVLAWAMIAYLRRHGVPRLAGGLGALVAMAGVLEPRGVALDHPSFIANVAWFPVLLLGWETVTARGARPWLGFLALAAAAQWFAGYPDFPLDSAVLLLIVGLISTRRPVGWSAALLAVALLLGAALAAVQLVPLAEAVGESTRAEGQMRYALWRSGAAVHSLPFLGRSLLGRYGAPALVLAGAGLWPPRRANVAWLAAFVWSLFALNFPLSLLYRLPVFSRVRFPYGWHHLEPVLAGFLVAAGVAALASQGSRWRIAAAVLGLAVAVMGALSLLGAPRTLPLSPPSPELVAARLPALRALLGSGERIVSALESASGATLRERLRSPTGYEPSLPPRRIVALLEPVDLLRQNWDRPLNVEALTAHADLAALLGVGLITVPRAAAGRLDAAGFVAVGAIPPDDVVLRRPAVPRARLVHRALLARDEGESLARTIAGARDAAMAVVLEERPPAALAPPPPGARETVAIVADEPERVELEASVASPALLVMTDTFFPGWQVRVDGNATRILRADHAFRAIAVGPGAHRIVFRYAPGSFRFGVGLSAAAAAAVLVLVAGRSVRRSSS